MGISKSISKGTKSLTKSVSKGTKSVVDSGTKAVEKGVDDTTKAVVDTTNKTVNTVVDTTNQVINTVVSETEKAYEESLKWVTDYDSRLKNVQEIAKKAEDECRKAGIPVDQYYNDFNNASKLIQQSIADGVEAVEWVVQYLEQNACQIALSTALSLAFFTILNPTNPEAEVAATPLSAASVAYMVAGQAGKMALSQACYQFACIIVEPIFLIPEVKGSMGKDGKHILTMALGNSIYYGIQASAAAWTVPATALMMMSAMFSVLIANLACTGTLPGGYQVMYGINDGYQKNFE
jgi:riboflavin synthase